MTFVVVKLTSSSSEVSLVLCAIATVDQAVEISVKAAAGCIEVLAAKEDKNLPSAQLKALLWLPLLATEKRLQD